MQIHIRRDDGMYLVGPGSMQVSDKPKHPFADLRAALAAIHHYKLSASVFCNGDGKYDQFTFEHITESSNKGTIA